MNKIKCIKYNNTLDDEAYKYATYNAFIELSLDEEELIITNKVKYKDKEYVLENDPCEIQKKIKEKQEEEKKFLEKLKKGKSTFSKFKKFIS